MSYETLRWKLFLSLWSKKLNTGVDVLLRGVKEIGKP
jgi:hypothetical protein